MLAFSAPPRARAKIDSSKDKSCVLVVDDDPVVRLFARTALKSVGYRTFGASNLGAAVALFGAVRPRVNVALLDVSMPGGDGPELLRELRRVRPSLPAVFMSGELDPELSNDLADRLWAEGATVLVAKPMRAAELCAAVAVALADGT